MELKWNYSRIKGNNCLVLQDADGNTTTIAITAFIQQFTKDKEKEIALLYNQLRDKEKIEQFADAERIRMQANLKQLQDEKAVLENKITNLLQEFNEKDISKEGALYQEAFALFINGKTDEALTVLDDAKLLAEEQQITDDYTKKRHELAEAYLLKAELLQLKFAFKDAAKKYEKALTFGPSWSTYLRAANFYKFLNEFAKADTLFHQALGLAKTAHQRAATLNNLAILQKDSNDYEGAEKGYREALEIRRDLALSNPQTYLPYVAGTLNNLAILQQASNDYEGAEKGYREALEKYRELARSNPQTYLPDVAMTLNNLAVLQKASNDYEGAEKGYREALEKYRELARSNPQAYLPDVAMTLINQGILYLQSIPDKQKSIDCAAEALTILKPLAEKLPYLKRYQEKALQVMHSWGVESDHFD